MPEGHTIHRLARDHTNWFAGQQIGVLSPQGRFEQQASRLSGMTFQRAEAFGKHLFHFWPTDLVTHIHLGLYGKFRTQRNPAAEPRGAVRMRMIGTNKTLDLNGPNQCSLINQKQFKDRISRLGPDPLRADADPEMVWHRIRSSRAAIGSLLLNQSVIAGIGNVYRAELLFLMGICPERPGNQISKTEFHQLWEHCVRLLNIGVKHNRIITVGQMELGKPISRAKVVERTYIYKSPICPRCGDDVYYWELGNRTIYACSRCQPN